MRVELAPPRAPLIRLRDPIRKNVACKCRTEGPKTAKPRSQSQSPIQKTKNQILHLQFQFAARQETRQLESVPQER